MPEINLEDTIAAVATPAGEGGISVIRISGPQAFAAADAVFRCSKGPLADFSSHTLHYGEIIENEKTLDRVVAGIFRSPNSYTGQDIVEISSHGGFLVTRAILNLLIQKGARHAEPGEFTKRAFLNGKIDLTQAEAVLDLIKAKSERALEAAARQLGGSLSLKIKSIKDEILKISAHIEAFLDFPDEQLEVYSDKKFLEKFARIEKDLRELLAGFSRGALLREGVGLAIAGRPNVGKSSLFNMLLSRDRALVSEYEGTTRDVLEEAIELSGIYIRLMDTAGLAAKAGSPLDAMGMDRTRGVLKEAQGYIFVIDGSVKLEEEDKKIFSDLDSSKPVLVVINKSDLPQKAAREELEKFTAGRERVLISTRTREGAETLERKISEMLWKENLENPGEQITRLRHKNAVEKSLAAFSRASEAFSRGESLEYIAADVKEGLDALRELTGEIYSEDLLDVIFSEFCIGK